MSFRPQLTVPSLCVFAAVDVVAANLVLHYVGYIIIFTLLVTKIYIIIMLFINVRLLLVALQTMGAHS